MESKIEATHRLQREGRWEQASAFRDEVRQRKRAEGELKAQANEAAWAAMLEHFPPLKAFAATIAAEPEADMPPLPIEVTGQSTDLPRDVLWVYEHLSDAAPPTTGLPSAGAWGLWHWAKANPDRFYEQLLPKAMKEKPIDMMTGVIEDPGIEEIERMLAEIAG